MSQPRNCFKTHMKMLSFSRIHLEYVMRDASTEKGAVLGVDNDDDVEGRESQSSSDGCDGGTDVGLLALGGMG